MKIARKNVFYILLIIVIIAVFAWSILIRISGSDPKVAQKYATAIADLNRIRATVVSYYCRNHQFPVSLKSLVPEMMEQMPRDSCDEE